MTYFPVQPRYSVYVDSLGDPLDDGYIYLGKANLDPTVYPAKASWDEAGLYPITFPVRTMNGYPLRDGIPAQMYLNFADNTEYSVLINDEDGVEVYSSTTGLIGYFPSGDGGDAATLNGLASDAAATADTIAARDSSGDIAANAFESTVATGTAPLTVASTTVVTNLNSDTVDGIQGSNIAKINTANTFTGGEQRVSGTAPVIGFLETDTTTYGRFVLSGGNLALQVGASGSGEAASSGNFRITGYANSDIGSVIVKIGGSDENVYTTGDNPSLGSGSGVSGSFTTSDAKTITVTDGIITSIV